MTFDKEINDLQHCLSFFLSKKALKHLENLTGLHEMEDEFNILKVGIVICKIFSHI